MSYCKKGIEANDILNNMCMTEISNTLVNCQLKCDRYTTCDTVALMEDEFKYRNGEILKCPHCDKYQDFCDCPDLFWKDIRNNKELDEQYGLLLELNGAGFNIVTCGNCGQPFIHRT